jgi:peptidoglycan hydrolase-like protein with peptidoglycan-binding domain
VGNAARASQQADAVQIGDSHRAAGRLQDQLVLLGYLKAEKRDAAQDVFDAASAKALDRFQRDAGLPRTGVGDAATCAAVDAALVADTLAHGVPPTARRGDVGDHVTQLQRALQGQGLLYSKDYRDKGGEFTGKTEAAVRAFQAAQGLEVTGVCGPETWSALRGAGEAVLDAATTVTGSPVLEVGDVGPSVFELESLLASWGAELAPDDVYDKATRGAVKRFQESNGLTADGRVNTATARTLYSEAAKPIQGDIPEGSGPAWLVSWLHGLGLRGEQLRVMWSIGMRESSGQPGTVSGMDGDGYGVFQLQYGEGHEVWMAKEFGWDVGSREAFAEAMTDPKKNFQAMLYLSKDGEDLSHWGHNSVDDPSLDLTNYASWAHYTTEEGETWDQAYIIKPFEMYYAQFPRYAKEAGVDVG